MSITQTVLDEIAAHINKQGGVKSSWYAGIASDPKHRLFSDHNVSEKDGWWIFRNAGSEAQARAAENSLLDWGCDGGSGGGDHNSVFVYAYLKTTTTKE